MKNLITEALIYLDMGWCVYPAHAVDIHSGLCTCGKLDCPCPGKHPIGRWTDFKTRLPTTFEVKLWFTSLECNIGIVTGSISKVVVVDVDGPAGERSLREVPLEPTLTSRTGGGGKHMFYSCQDIYPGKVRVLDGVDLRGEGGYVVLPPSLHRSGNHYEWVDVQPLANFNKNLFDRRRVALDDEFEPNTDGWYKQLIHGVSEGSRSISAARLAGRYFNLGLSLPEVQLLIDAWNQRNIPPLTKGELRLTVSAVYRKHTQSQGTKIVETLSQIHDLLMERDDYEYQIRNKDK